MSEPRLKAPPADARSTGVRSARVWQPVDLLHPLLVTKGFLSSSWRDAPIPFFSPTDFASLAKPSAELRQTGGASPAKSEQEDQPEATTDTAEPLAADTAQALALARAEGHAQGVEQTRAALQAEIELTLQTRLANDQSLVQAVQAALDSLKQSPDILYEPLKRLALHLAEQLVLAELSLDSKAIERLVHACTIELTKYGENMVQVELHSSDLAVWNDLSQRNGLPPQGGLRLLANDALPRGSVRARANDTLVEDLILNRLTGLARLLGVNEARWRTDSAFNPERTLRESPAPLQESGPAPPGAALD